MRYLTRTSALLLSVAIAAAAAASPATAAAAPRWDHPGFDAGDSYYNPVESVINERSVGRLARTWSVRLRDHAESCAGFSAPLVTGGLVLATDKSGISAFAATDGVRRWAFDWDEPSDNLTPRLAVSGGLLIAANGDCNSRSDPDGRLTAIDLTSGKTVWQRSFDRPVHAVAVDMGVVVVSGWSPSDEEAVTAFRATDGKPLWTKTGWSSTGVALNGVIVMRKTDGAGQADGGTSAIDIRDGSLRWSRLGNWVAETAFDGLFYVTSGGRLLAVDSGSGAVLWSAAGKASSLVAVDGQRVYRSSGRVVEALNVRDGKRVWAVRSPGEAGQPVRAGGLVYAGGQVLRASDGTAVGPELPGHLIVTGGAAYQVEAGSLSSWAATGRTAVP
jgi:outer membrane protein assembly factor BamB